MATTFKYMIDEKGDKHSVVVPIKTWQKLNENYRKLQNKINTLTGIKNGLAEIREAGKKRTTFQSLKGFLHESNS